MVDLGIARKPQADDDQDDYTTAQSDDLRHDLVTFASTKAIHEFTPCHICFSLTEPNRDILRPVSSS